jgi:hypothetical protein
MSIKFQCVECGCEVKVPDEAAGKRGKCPQCSAVNDVPKPMDASSDDDFLDFIMGEVDRAPAPVEDDPIPFDDGDTIGLAPEKPAPAPAPQSAPPPAAPADDDEDDLLGLAPIDEEEERERAEQTRKLMEQERELLADNEGDGGRKLEQRDDLDASDLHHFIVNYCSDMAEGKLDRAKTHIEELKKYRGLAGEAIEGFLAGKVDPVDRQALASIPTPVLAGFLKTLKDDLG